MAESDTTEGQAQPVPARFERSAADRIRDYEFPLAVRGYDRQAVDAFVDQVVELVRELESRQTRETVVQRALDEVGVETAGILQRAHETADEIAARSRAQAEGRLQRAERESEILRRQADEYAEKVVLDTRLLWDERQRLLDDLRQLADEVLATADDAAERVSLPEQLGSPEELAAAEELLPAEEFGPAEELGPAAPLGGPGALADDLTDEPTTEVELDVLPGGAGIEDPQPTEEFDREPGALPEEPDAEEVDAEPRRPRAGNEE